MKGDRVEAVSIPVRRHADVRDRRHARRPAIEITTARGVVEVTEVTRSGTPVRAGRFMANRLIALVEHPAIEGDGAASTSRRNGAWVAKQRAAERERGAMPRAEAPRQLTVLGDDPGDTA